MSFSDMASSWTRHWEKVEASRTPPGARPRPHLWMACHYSNRLGERKVKFVRPEELYTGWKTVAELAERERAEAANTAVLGDKESYR